MISMRKDISIRRPRGRLKDDMEVAYCRRADKIGYIVRKQNVIFIMSSVVLGILVIYSLVFITFTVTDIVIIVDNMTVMRSSPLSVSETTKLYNTVFSRRVKGTLIPM